MRIRRYDLTIFAELKIWCDFVGWPTKSVPDDFGCEVCRRRKCSGWLLWLGKVHKMSKPALETHIQDIKNSRPGPGKPIEQ